MTFTIDFGESFDLLVEDIWPDGGAPQNPTAEDVAEVMRNYGPKMLTLRNWNLEPSVYVDGVEVWR